MCGCKSGNAFACYEANHGKAGECGCGCHKSRAVVGVDWAARGTASFTVQLTDAEYRRVMAVMGFEPAPEPDVPSRVWLEDLP